MRHRQHRLRRPGYSANVTFSLSTGGLTTSVTQSDLLAVLNDVHKGRDTDSSWGWVIDASALLLLVVTLTGIGIQILQRSAAAAPCSPPARCRSSPSP